MTFTDNGDGTWTSTDAVDNGDGTWTSTTLTDNGDGTWTDTSSYRDIDLAASPVTSGWRVMGTTGYPVATAAINNDNGYSGAATTVGAWAASPLTNLWTAGPVWTQES